jgi:hypothetical protein
MSLKIPASLKKEFKKGFDEYIKVMGRTVQAYLEPFTVDCPNCIYDNTQKKSSNVYDETFKTPLNIFPGSSAQRIIYPAPFNVVSVSGVQYDPSIPNPKILKAAICPTCKGEGVLIQNNIVCIQAVVTRGISKTDVEGPDMMDLSGGLDGLDVVRLKSFSCNYSVIRDAKYFIIEGIKAKLENPPRLKGLGSDAIVEAYLTTVKEDISSSDKYDKDVRIDINVHGTASNQAPSGTPTIPPVTAGDDVW